MQTGNRGTDCGFPDRPLWLIWFDGRTVAKALKKIGQVTLGHAASLKLAEDIAEFFKTLVRHGVRDRWIFQCPLRALGWSSVVSRK